MSPKLALERRDAGEIEPERHAEREVGLKNRRQRGAVRESRHEDVALGVREF